MIMATNKLIVFYWPVLVFYSTKDIYLMTMMDVPTPKCRKDPMERLSEERQAGVGDGGIILIGDAAIVTEDLAFFGSDQSQQAVDG